MPDIPRLNPAIRALESGNPAFVTFSPPEIGAAQSIAAAPSRRPSRRSSASRPMAAR